MNAKYNRFFDFCEDALAESQTYVTPAESLVQSLAVSRRSGTTTHWKSMATSGKGRDRVTKRCNCTPLATWLRAASELAHKYPAEYAHFTDVARSNYIEQLYLLLRTPGSRRHSRHSSAVEKL